MYMIDMALHSKFQSTLPLRGATHTQMVMWAYPYISIHAPLAGSDFVHRTA